MSCKRAIAGLALAVLGVVGLDQATAQTRIRYNNGWLFSGGEAYAPLAQDRGCFAREKLDVTMDRGFGSGDTVTKIAAGAYDIGEADFNNMAQFNAVRPQSPLIAVFIIADNSPTSVIAMKSSGITKPQDLVGKSIGDAIGESSRVLFPAFAKANHIDPNSVTWVNTAVNLREQLLPTKRADAIAGHMFTVQNGLLALGVKYEDTILFRYTDWGVNIFGAALVTTPSWAAAHADATKAFVRCIAEAIKVQFADPKAAIAAAKARNSLLNEAIELASLSFTHSLVLTDNVRKNGLSYVTRERLERALAQVGEALGTPTPPPDQVWTDKYLPPASVLKLD